MCPIMIQLFQILLQYYYYSLKKLFHNFFREIESYIILNNVNETIKELSRENLSIAFSDGSSDKSLKRGQAGILFFLPCEEKVNPKINKGFIAPNFTSKLLAIPFYLTYPKLRILLRDWLFSQILNWP